VLSQSTGVLADLNYTLGILNPVLRDLQPVAPRLTTLLQKVVPAATGAVPTIKGVAALVPPAERSLSALPSLANKAVPAIKSLGSALPPVTPILAGLRPYAPDAVAGFFGGVGGYSGGYYDANGHYTRVAFEGGPGGFGGLLNLLGGVVSKLPPFNGTRFGLLSACPGGSVEASPNGGNPWTNPDVLPATGTLCNTANNHP
jgi:phospholipid/cholesterol/gamma-HCH transport system substrate-binding protein